MLVKKEKYYLKKINRQGKYRTSYDTQKMKKTTYLLFGVIPIFVNYEVVGGEYER